MRLLVKSLFVFSISSNFCSAHFHEEFGLGPAAANFFNLPQQQQPTQILQPLPQAPTQSFQPPRNQFFPNPPQFQPVQAPPPTQAPVQQIVLPSPVQQMAAATPVIQQVSQAQPSVASSPSKGLFNCQSGEIRIPVGANTFRLNNRVYWFSWSDPANAQKKWTDAEKHCRSQCMELVSLDTPGETEFVANMIPQADIHGMWTGGRLCNYPGCEKEAKFQPLRANGWVWATKGVQIGSDPGGRFSAFGAMGRPQPDNFLGSKGGESEDCIALLSNWYSDGNKVFHDLACSEPLPFVCEQP